MIDNKVHNWLLLIHQLPPKPDYFRVKIWRRLQKIGAVAVKQSVYVLPDTAQAYEDLHWVVKEIEAGKGTASLLRTVFLEGLTDSQVQELFIAAREVDYGQLADVGNELLARVVKDQPVAEKLQKEFSRLQDRFDRVVSMDFFRAPGRERVSDILSRLHSLFFSKHDTVVPTFEEVKNKVWVTRKGLFVDRLCSIWLIKRFIDLDAAFIFVDKDEYVPAQNEIRFDMFDAEFTHQGDMCTFEVLRAALQHTREDRALTILAEIVHDIDLKDNKFSRPETAGILALFSSMTQQVADDEQRIQRTLVMLDELYNYWLFRHHAAD